MNVYICVSGESITTHSSVEDVIANIRTLTGGDTSHDDVIRSLQVGTSYVFGSSSNVSLLTYVMGDAIPFEVSSVVEPVSTTVASYYTISDDIPYSDAPLSSDTDAPIDMSTVYYDYTAP